MFIKQYCKHGEIIHLYIGKIYFRQMILLQVGILAKNWEANCEPDETGLRQSMQKSVLLQIVAFQMFNKN